MAEARFLLRRERHGEVLDPDRAASRRHHHFRPRAALPDGEPIPGGQHETGVVHRRPELGHERKRFLEAGETGIAVHEDGVEPGLRPPEHLALALRFLLDLQDVAHRAHHHGPRARRVDALQQRHELEAQRTPAERERFEDDRVGRHRIEGGEQQVAPCRPIRVVDGNVIAVAQRHEARVRDPDRRQLHDAHPARHAPADRHAAAHEVHVGSRVGQRLGDEAGAHQMADAQQMLDIDHDDWHGRAPKGGSRK